MDTEKVQPASSTSILGDNNVIVANGPVVPVNLNDQSSTENPPHGNGAAVVYQSDEPGRHSAPAEATAEPSNLAGGLDAADVTALIPEEVA